MHSTHKVILFTSIAPNPRTAEYVRNLSQTGYHVRLITTESNRKQVDAILPHLSTSTLYVSSFERPKMAAREIRLHLQTYDLEIANWINITDQTTAVYLYTIEECGWRFPFLDVYKCCRIKPIARHRLSGTTTVFSLNSDISDIPDTSLPRRPFIVKPVCGSGSKGVRKIETPSDWQDYWYSARNWIGEPVIVGSYDLQNDVLLEVFHRGTEYEIDGFVASGSLQICAIGYKFHDYSRALGFRELGGVMCHPASPTLDRSVASRLTTYTRSLLSVLDFCSGAFHIEVMLTPYNTIELIEVNPRPGGGTVTKMVQKLSGVDLTEACVHLWLGTPYSAKPVCTAVDSILYAIVYPSCNGTLEQIKPREKIEKYTFHNAPYIAEWLPLAQQGERLSTTDGEVYLGEFHVENAHVSPHDMQGAVRELLQQLERDKFVVQRPDSGSFGTPHRGDTR